MRILSMEKLNMAVLNMTILSTRTIIAQINMVMAQRTPTIPTTTLTNRGGSAEVVGLGIVGACHRVDSRTSRWLSDMQSIWKVADGTECVCRRYCFGFRSEVKGVLFWFFWRNTWIEISSCCTRSQCYRILLYQWINVNMKIRWGVDGGFFLTFLH